MSSTDRPALARALGEAGLQLALHACSNTSDGITQRLCVAALAGLSIDDTARVRLSGMKAVEAIAPLLRGNDRVCLQPTRAWHDVPQRIMAYASLALGNLALDRGACTVQLCAQPLTPDSGPGRSDGRHRAGPLAAVGLWWWGHHSLRRRCDPEPGCGSVADAPVTPTAVHPLVRSQICARQATVARLEQLCVVGRSITNESRASGTDRKASHHAKAALDNLAIVSRR